MSTDEITIGVGVSIDQSGDDGIVTQIMSHTQQGQLPTFWAPKRSARNMPRGIRQWSIWEKKPELAIIIYDPELFGEGKVMLKYHDTAVVVLMLDDFARCGMIVLNKSNITQIYTIRSQGQRDLHGHEHK